MAAEERQLHIRISPENTELLNKILEGYDNLALLTAVDAAEGRFLLWLTADSEPDLRRILSKLPFAVEEDADAGNRKIFEDT